MKNRQVYVDVILPLPIKGTFTYTFFESVEVGQRVKKGQTIMIVEAMKTMNHVPSTQDGVVSKILVKDGEPVEFGQPLISVK